MAGAITALVGLAPAASLAELVSAAAEFGPLYPLVLAFCALNALAVLYFVWRVFREKPSRS